ncbi:hypothetical protein BDV28DRAFT_141991 [Aspergillus coremiiformis]|uniref:Uncharacterized protein n=1 Tax=Aspergillus coremiiformis TaxID=138285 RepID=A0A5N6YUF7_9EURO|nr:hypothetical protein BDV28DRAFT_141991 [Aspergillus coremiiformis]
MCTNIMSRELWATLFPSHKRICTRVVAPSKHHIFPFLSCAQLPKAYKMVSTSASYKCPFPQNRDPIYSDKIVGFDPHSYSSGRWTRIREPRS